MKFNLIFASTIMSSDKGVEIEINTLEDMEKLSQKYNEQLIVDFKEKDIVVYDSYWE